MGLKRRPIQLVSGGLNEAAADLGGMDPSEALTLKNVYFETPSVVSIRRGSVDGDRMMDDNGVPAPVTSVPFCDFFESQGKIFAIGHSTAEDKHYVYELTTAGINPAGPGDISPKIIPTASVSGKHYNTAEPVLFNGEGWYNKKFYAADVDGAIGMIEFNGDLGTVAFPEFTLGSGPAAPLRPKYLFTHRNHLILLGYGDENTPIAPDLLRSSKIGQPSQWDGSDFWQVGNTEEPLLTGISVGNFAVLFKQFRIFRMAGSHAANWSFVAIDPDRGAVNHRCATYYDDWVWFLSSEGFARIGISGPSELFVDKAKLSFAAFDNFQNCWVEANVPERMVVFACHEVGAAGTFPTLLVQVDTRTGRFVTREYLAAGPITLISMHAARVPQVGAVVAGLGPSGPPTIGAATVVSGTGWTSNWTNGDLTAGTTTRHETRDVDEAGSFAQDASEVVPDTDTVISGMTPGTIYEERVRHERNGIFSIYSPASGGQEVKTDPPVAPYTLYISGSGPGGVTLVVRHLNHEGVGNIEIWERTAVAPCPASAGSWFLAKTILNAMELETTVISGMICGKAYQFKARWVRTGFTDSAYGVDEPCVVPC